jgi:hypothetical protein
MSEVNVPLHQLRTLLSFVVQPPLSERDSPDATATRGKILLLDFRTQSIVENHLPPRRVFRLPSPWAGEGHAEVVHAAPGEAVCGPEGVGTWPTPSSSDVPRESREMICAGLFLSTWGAKTENLHVQSSPGEMRVQIASYSTITVAHFLPKLPYFFRRRSCYGGSSP